MSGPSRPMRIAAFALLGVALIAATVGTVTVVNSNNTNNVAATSTESPSPTSEQPPGPPPSSDAPAPTSSAVPSSTSSAPSSTPSPSSSPAAPSEQAGGEDQQVAAQWVTLRIYNNSTISGLASKAGNDFKGAGWNVSEVSNYSEGIIPTTTAYYRPGTDEEDAAKALASSFGMRAEPRFDGIKKSNAGVIVIVTNDYKGGGK